MNRTGSDPRPPARILVVDDDRNNRNVLELMLASEGFVITTASSGDEALEIVAKSPPDLVLLDVVMPGLDGFEVTSRLKSYPRTKRIPIILITAHGDRAQRLRGLVAGAEDFLTKPVDRAELTVRVRNLLRLSAAIDDAENAQLAAVHANAAKTRFLGAMSHELRTPLNAIVGYTQLMALGIHGVVSPEQAKDLDRIKRASGYLLRLVDDVLTMAHLERARQLLPVAIGVNVMLDEMHGLCVLQAEARGLVLAVTPSACEIVVTADVERFQQILINLVTNAIKFSREGGRITVTADCDATGAAIHVTDTGLGIRKVDVDRVFEPFVQIDPQLTMTTTPGVGLGLSISREFARAMGGDITLETSEGVGSTFTIRLPIALAVVPASIEPSLLPPDQPITITAIAS